MPACVEQDFQKKVPVSLSYKFIMKLGKFCLLAGILSFYNERFVHFFISGHPVFQVGFFRLRLAADKRPIGLVDFSVAKHGIEPLQGFGCLGEYGDSADRPVDSVGNAEIDLAGFGVPLGYESLVLVT